MLNWKAVVLKRCDINISAVSGVSISSRGSLLMHAERDIVMATPSVCPSNACTISKRMHIIITLFDGLVEHHSTFLSPAAVTIFQGEPP